MTADVSVFVPQPQAPCKQCVENAVHQDEKFGLVWCQHTRYGGVYLTELGMWNLAGPYEDEAAFKRATHNTFARLFMKSGTLPH